jgi:predicted neutral ceramidase superfamily lipid hydrolase
MNKLIKFLVAGVLIGIIDVIPMILMKLTWDENISAFTMWVVISYLVYCSNQNINQIIKSIIISFLVLFPNAILIGWNNPIDLVPVIIMTFILSILMGFITGKINGKQY